MGQVDGLPVAVIVGQVAGGEKSAGLLESAGPAGAESEVFGGIVGMAEVKPPAEIEQQPLAHATLGGGALGQAGLHVV